MITPETRCWYQNCRVRLIWKPREHYGGDWVDEKGQIATPNGHVHGSIPIVETKDNDEPR